MLIALGRISRSAFKNFWRNGYLTVATLCVMALTLFVITWLALISVMTEVALANLQDQIDVSIYFRLDVPEEQILQVREKIAAQPNVKEVRYVSSHEAYDRFQERHKDNPILIQSLKELGENPLEPALNIKAAEASQFEAIAAFIEKNISKEIVDTVNYRQNEAVINKLMNIVGIVRRAGAVGILVLAAITILVAFNTIRLAIYTNRDEIGIMRLVGASNWFIRGPFLFEGAFDGIVAGVTTFVLVYPIARFVSPKISLFLSGFDLLGYYQTHAWELLLLQIGVGVAIGLFSSAIAVRRYLKI